jgi:branched-chain amino acid transport system substrate-binding protein
VLLVDGGISVMQALKQQGISMKAPLLPGLSDPDLIAKVGSALDGIIGSTYGTVPPGVPGRPGLRTFTNGMKAAGLNPNNPSSASAFVSADTFIEGMKLAGRCPTRQGFIDALHKAKSFSGAGLLPAPISYRPALTPNGNPAKCSWFVTVQNGKMVPDKAPVCGDYMDVNTGKIVAG